MKLAALVGVAGLAVAACAPASAPPSVPVKQQGGLLINVVDSLFDAGRSASVQLDQSGQPTVAYLLYQPVLEEGDIPPAIRPGDPQPPSVVTATLAKGIWTRSAIPPQATTGKAAGLAPEIANADGQAIPGVTTSLAIDGQGKHHVVWATPKGLFYSTDAGGSFGPSDQISTAQAYGASIAVASDGTVWISFYAGGSLDVATGRAGSWTVEKVAVNAGPATTAGTLSAIRVDSSGRPVVAFASQDTTVVAERSGSSWTSRTVPGSGGLGVSLALDKDGNPHVAYYDGSGGVHHAHSIGGAAWEVTDLGTVELPSAPPPSPAPTPSSSPSASPSATVQTPPQARWSTGIALDDQGVHHITWADTGNDRIVLASNQGGKFQSQPIQGSDGGSTPSIAVSGDGKTLAVAWFDSTNTNLDVAVSPSGGLTLAHPLPTLHQPSVTAPASPTGTALACQPDGTTLQIKAQNIAFDKNCLAAPAGQPFTIEFDNQDPTLHNVDIYDRQGGSHIGGAGPTDFFTGPGTTTYQVDALEAGTYFFQCDVHPTAMFGTFVVAKP